MLRKSLNILSVSRSFNSLFFTPAFNFSGRGKKTRAQRAKYFEARPNLYKKVVKMKLPDFRSKTLKFPLSIPVRNLYIYRPVKTRPLTHHHDFLNFKMMTGNEILLYLEKPENLREGELCSALLELRKREGAESVNWNSHQWIVGTIKHIKQNCSNYSAQNVSNLLTAFDDLRISDVELYQLFAKVSFKMIFNAKASTFGRIFSIYIPHTHFSNEDFRKHLMDQLSRFIFKFNPKSFTKTFEAAFQTQRLTKFLFDDHFYVFIRKRSYYLGIKFLPRCVKVLLQMKYDIYDTELWQDSIIPAFDKLILRKMSHNNSEQFVKEIEELTTILPVNFLIRILGKAKAKHFYLSTVIQSLHDHSLSNQVLNDLRFYRELQIQKKNKDKGKSK